MGPIRIALDRAVLSSLPHWPDPSYLLVAMSKYRDESKPLIIH
ncbi:MAG: hypothetical protein OIF58_08195 [Cohaesibacter sp.]|nr:hypothetical protein [Cohaesibacter sp.]